MPTLEEVPALKIHIPGGQYHAHTVRVTSDFVVGEGVEVHTYSGTRHQHAIDRLGEFFFTDREFRFRSLYLNATGYIFYLVFRAGTGYHPEEATPTTNFAVVEIERSLATEEESRLQGVTSRYAPIFANWS